MNKQELEWHSRVALDRLTQQEREEVMEAVWVCINMPHIGFEAWYRHKLKSDQAVDAFELLLEYQEKAQPQTND